MTRFAGWLLLGCSAVLISMGSFGVAQQTPSSDSSTPYAARPDGQAIATLHTGTKLVVVDVVVRDKNGRPIQGLTRNDLVVSEAGKGQSIHSFEEYSAPAMPAAEPSVPKLPPGMFTNFTPAGANGPLNVLLLDGLNTNIMDQAYFRQQLADYLNHVPAGTRIAIFGMADHLYMLQGFTSDKRVLSAALMRSKANPRGTMAGGTATTQAALLSAMNDPGGGLKSAAASAQPSSSAQASEFAISSGAGSLMSSAMDTFIEHVSVVETVLRIQLTIEEMTQLAQWLQKFPGRKNVLWASAAFPLGVDPNFSNQVNTDIPGETSEIYMKMINMFAESRVSIYPIDPRGMQTDTSFNAESIAQLNQISAARTISRQFYVNEATEHATMQAIASDTGGLPVYNRNNLTQAVSDAIDDGRSYYTISYTPSEKKTGGEWRSVRVQFADPLAYKGAQILCRKGYYADNLKVPAHKTGTAFVKLDPNSPAAESHPYSKSAMLHGAPFPQDIPFTTRVLPASQSVEQTIAPDNQGPPNHKMKPPFHRYDVDAAAAARYFNLIQGPDGHYMGSVQMAVMAYDSDGRLLNTASRTLSFDLTPHEYEQFQRLGYREHLEISTPAKGVTFLRIGIEERTTGRVGAVEIASSAVNELAPPDYASKLPSLRSR